MRKPIYLCIVFTIAALAQPAAKPTAKAKSKLDAKAAAPAPPATGIKTPGVQIPFASLKPEAEIPLLPSWMVFTDSPLAPTAEMNGLLKIDVKANKLGEKYVELGKPCGGAVTAFGTLWIPACGDQSIVRVDSKTGKVTKTLPVGTGSIAPEIAASSDSVWAFTDDRITVSRIDPETNEVVAEFRILPDCSGLMSGESSLWVACPAENRVLRINPALNQVEKEIETSPGPKQLVFGESSVWVLCEKDGKIDRIDPKTNKVTKTIELGTSAAGGSIADGLGSLWVTMPGFPLTRIDTGTEKVVQQFYGEGGGAIYVGSGALWLTNPAAKTLLRIDPKRVAATLAE